MDCHIKDRTKYVADYLDGILSKEEVADFEKHVFECDLCFQELLFQQEAAKVIKQEGERLLQHEPKSILIAEKFAQGFKRLILQISSWRWRPAFAYLAIVLIIAVGAYLSVTKLSSDRFPFNYENNVPWKYQSLILRGNSSSMRADPKLDIFINNFRAAIGEYNIFEYESAIKIFSRIEPLAKLLIRDDANKNRRKWVKDYYFYRAMSHLALGTDKQLSEEEKAEHLKKAIDDIKMSIQISEKYQLKNTNLDREHYFLMVTYLALGEKKEAERIFDQIPAHSTFKIKAQKSLRR